MYSTKNKDDSQDREHQSRKEVDDLISKYTSKKSKAKLGVGPTIRENNRDLNDYSSLKYGQSNAADRTYGGTSNTYSSRRSSQYDSISKALPGSSNAGSRYDLPAPPSSKYGGSDYRRSSITSNNSDFSMANSTYTDKYDKYSHLGGGYGAVGNIGSGGLTTSASSANIYAPVSSGPPPTAAQRYLAQSKSSSNLFLFPQSNMLSSTLDSRQDPIDRKALTRQQKTLSMHGLPGSTSSTSLLQRGVQPSGGSSSTLLANLRNNQGQDDFYFETENDGLGNSNQLDWRKKPLWSKNVNAKVAVPHAAPPPIVPVHIAQKPK